ncbi:hypothetical protein FN846DRAFT_390769 [Sphaerosporella brunnea]|uniref:Uncharacterized protein n=1 Tax=Sphaerosporella brunnea TaxID=1250544 RepID=A0A5J5F5V1_9PEZI|nr:hypothetical protein FN846DRAFT_390769 [Sphaerosporella brunnea]
MNLRYCCREGPGFAALCALHSAGSARHRACDPGPLSQTVRVLFVRDVEQHVPVPGVHTRRHGNVATLHIHAISALVGLNSLFCFLDSTAWGVCGVNLRLRISNFAMSSLCVWGIEIEYVMQGPDLSCLSPPAQGPGPPPPQPDIFNLSRACARALSDM